MTSICEYVLQAHIFTGNLFVLCGVALSGLLYAGQFLFLHKINSLNSTIPFNNCAVINPIKPNPIITTVSPNCGFSKRIPCKPIDPVGKNNFFIRNDLPVFGYQVLGTQTYSACCPLDAIRSPTLTSVTPFPTATTTPELQYLKAY